jgi:DNA invertase Pin-like site-specific DNA recombinase
MQKQVVIYAVVRSSPTTTSDEPLERLRQAVEDRGDTVIKSFVDYGPEVRVLRQRNTGWKSILSNLDGVDQVVVATAGDLPGKSVQDLIKFLGLLRDRGISLYLHHEQIDTDDGSAAFLDLLTTYRAAKRSQAIRRGQSKSNKRPGRPAIPHRIVVGIQACLRAGGRIRATAKKFGVSPGSVVNIRRAMSAGPDRLAA